MNLIPAENSNKLNYWCTWALQNYISGQNNPEFDFSKLIGSDGAQLARNNLNGDLLFNKDSIINDQYHMIKKDLYIMLDDGWDFPIIKKHPIDLLNNLSSFDLHQDRFPSLNGSIPNKLKELNKKLIEMGWAGVGVWVAAQRALKYKSIWDITGKKYWTARILWSKEANIKYWKVDWGINAGRINFRKKLTEIAKKIYPDLIIEHANCTSPFNNLFNTGRTSEDFIKFNVKLLEFSDVIRLYDTSPQLEHATMLDRIAMVLKQAPKSGKGMGILNVEDNPYMAAALGCSIGLMRYNYINYRKLNEVDIDHSFCKISNKKERINQAIRAIRWQKIAKPFSAWENFTEISQEILTDRYKFIENEFWDKKVINKNVSQSAPAIISRGMELPKVNKLQNFEPPFVVCAQFPNKSIGIATLGRTLSEKEYILPRVDIECKINKENKTFGIFGQYNSLKLKSNFNLKFDRILFQDLMKSDSIEVTDELEFNTSEIMISSKFISKFSEKYENDLSDPGFILKII